MHVRDLRVPPSREGEEGEEQPLAVVGAPAQEEEDHHDRYAERNRKKGLEGQDIERETN